jgi:hypothetical protein
MTYTSIIIAALMCCAASTASTEERAQPFVAWPPATTVLPPLAGGPVTTTSPLLAATPLTPTEKLRDNFEAAKAVSLGRKVRTKAEYDHVRSLWQKYIVSYKRDFISPPEYDRPYTGKLTIERVVVTGDKTLNGHAISGPGEMITHCQKPDIACAVRAGDLSWCKIYIADDNYLKKYSQRLKAAGLNLGDAYAGILRHEIAHCNGWAWDHPHKTVTTSR